MTRRLRSAARITAGVALPLLWSNVAQPRLPGDPWTRTAANTVVAVAYAGMFGSSGRWWSARGWRWGSAAFAVTYAGYAVALCVPRTRAVLAVLAERAGPDPLSRMLIHIPIGTVLSEESIFRATLDPLLDATFGPRTGLPAAACVFGLWHIAPARAAGDDIPATVVFTTVGGLLFGLLARRTGSATAPALLHLALNTGGVLAPHLAARWAPVPTVSVDGTDSR